MPRSSARQLATYAPVSWPAVLHQAQQRFHIRRFRPGQREVLDAVFQRKNVLAIMPTGAGKSLTYQLPALLLPKPVVVVSPLIALMQDQQEKAADAEIAVEKLDSTLTHKQQQTAQQDIDQGIAQLIYVTPERLQTPEFQAELQSAGGISLLVVDEAHCIPQWGHDFRPAYLQIGEARRALGNPPVLALTATATEDVAQEILASLHAEESVRINTGSERENLFLAVHPTVNNQAKQARILAMLQQEEQGSGIVYTASIRSANDLYDFLTERGVPVGHYHGRMPARERERVQQAFMRGDHRVMIATKAFGLGIDKPDIRFVVHFEFPDSLETYFQEAGRAGRDGKPAKATLLYRLEDKRIQSFFLAGRYPRLEEVRAVYESVISPGALSQTAPSFEVGSPTQTPPGAPSQTASSFEVGSHKVPQRRAQVILHLLREANLIGRHRTGYTLVGDPPTDDTLEALLQTYVDRANRDKERLADMMHYAETPNCRTQVIRAYFGEHEGAPCKRCDNCLMAEQSQGAPSQSAPSSQVGSKAPEVTVIPTIHGEIHTTAPETLLPAAPEAAFAPGDRVRHKRFGSGKVLDTYNDVVLVDFLKGGSRRLRADFLESGV